MMRQINNSHSLIRIMTISQIIVSKKEITQISMKLKITYQLYMKDLRP